MTMTSLKTSKLGIRTIWNTLSLKEISGTDETRLNYHLSKIQEQLKPEVAAIQASEPELLKELPNYQKELLAISKPYVIQEDGKPFVDELGNLSIDPAKEASFLKEKQKLDEKWENVIQASVDHSEFLKEDADMIQITPIPLSVLPKNLTKIHMVNIFNVVDGEK